MGLAAFTSELHWPLSEENFAYAVRLGYTCGSVGALITAVCLLVMDRKRMWMAAPVAVVVTCSITFAGVWWHLISGLG